MSSLCGRRLGFVSWGAVFAAFVLTPACDRSTAIRKPAQASSVRDDRPSFVILLADDLGWGDVGYHGSEIQTPNIDALARTGVRLEQFYVLPICSPTRAALLTGRYPMRYGLQAAVLKPFSEAALPVEERTLAEVLRGAGYATAMVGKWHLGHYSPHFRPEARGFDYFYGCYEGRTDHFMHAMWSRNGQPVLDEGYSTDRIADEAVRLLQERDAARPMFLFVSFTAPHEPLQAPDAAIRKYRHVADARRRVYMAMVDRMDEAIGRIVAAVDDAGMRDNTLIAFLSDNGATEDYGGDNGPLSRGKGSLYEGGVRSPAILNWPARLAPAVEQRPLHVVDVFPTLLGLARIAPDDGRPLDGVDLWPFLTAETAPPHEELLLNVTPWDGALRIGDWKYFERRREGKRFRRLYNLRDDPAERVDLAEQYPQRLEQMAARLAEYRAQSAELIAKPMRRPEDRPVEANP
ncbi:MAG: arylsulfatase [Planctomycetota bacterium]|nr:MAG: arylsulfatase [Planctomycetota bacterium]